MLSESMCGMWSVLSQTTCLLTMRGESNDDRNQKKLHFTKHFKWIDMWNVVSAVADHTFVYHVHSTGLLVCNGTTKLKKTTW